ncbi:MAG: trimethylamine methyltransferase family protein, partial [Actinomycetes bacterium]
DVIAEVGPFSDFLSHDDTYKGMRGQSRSTLIDRRVREDWAASGSTSLYERALAEARRILETHVPTPLPDEVAAKLRSIIKAAEEELGVH